MVARQTCVTVVLAIAIHYRPRVGRCRWAYKATCTDDGSFPSLARVEELASTGRGGRLW
jgi:hypothetical protein